MRNISFLQASCLANGGSVAVIGEKYHAPPDGRDKDALHDRMFPFHSNNDGKL